VKEILEILLTLEHELQNESNSEKSSTNWGPTWNNFNQQKAKLKTKLHKMNIECYKTNQSMGPQINYEKTTQTMLSDSTNIWVLLYETYFLHNWLRKWNQILELSVK
jgi:capsule polysaccharide modification protein KpsS